MEISYQCAQCGRWYTATERSAGKTVKCKDCGAPVKVPEAPDEPAGEKDIYGLSDKEQTTAASPPLREPVEQGAWSSAVIPRSAASKKPKGTSSNSKSFFGGGIGTIGLLVLLAIRIYFRWERHQARQAQPNNQAVIAAPFPADTAVPNQNAPPWKMPALPRPPRATQIEPGVMLSEIILHAGPQGAAKLPGHGGKLWLYLPAGEHASRSLPCVLIAGAGSNLITGMDLGEGDRPEHLPYSRAGFAVIAYELDGRMPEEAKGNLQALARASRAFLSAQAGLINARVAIEYATTQVPAIDPRRLYAVGHSSAATLALLVAENEPRIAAGVAFAPAVDLTVQYPPEAQKKIAMVIPGAADLFTRFNPRTNEAKINCPLFLFYADDDTRFASQVRDLGTRLKQSGKKVAVSSVASGGHYDSMIKVGVPRAITWLKSLSKAND
jgi:dienelactone hydrolase/DNA-directed RNA polymerase subunit RPC12/RpoP